MLNLITGLILSSQPKTKTKTDIALSHSPPSRNWRNLPAYIPVFRSERDTAKSRIFELLLLPPRTLIVIKLTPASALPDTENSKNPHSRTASLPKKNIYPAERKFPLPASPRSVSSFLVRSPVSCIFARCWKIYSPAPLHPLKPKFRNSRVKFKEYSRATHTYQDSLLSVSHSDLQAQILKFLSRCWKFNYRPHSTLPAKDRVSASAYLSIPNAADSGHRKFAIEKKTLKKKSKT